ncbi:MAG: hypothetical protein COV47_02015 [Candidatus Diapherotrites archaeon CG11_big_fil_rev_8_21_14_0_20_37_9]|nr:MAG: hypothetical protein COV47_02015 [Candidatus Diapherotrites archaeon CG11_big_fil_rev_8_21_14_0_20_37_9]
MSQPFEFTYKSDDTNKYFELFSKVLQFVDQNAILIKMPRTDVESYEIKSIDEIEPFIKKSWCRFTAELERQAQIKSFLDYCEENKKNITHYELYLTGGIKYGLRYQYFDETVYKKYYPKMAKEKLGLTFEQFDDDLVDISNIIGGQLDEIKEDEHDKRFAQSVA